MKRILITVITTVIFLTAMTTMIFFMLFRDTSSESGILTGGENPDGSLLYTENADALFEDSEPVPGKEGYFCIPTEEGTAEGDIEIDDRPMDEMTLISIPLKDPDYYYNHNLSGSRERIGKIGFCIHEGKVIFEIRTEGISVMDSAFENGFLYVRYDDPRRIYKKIVLIDPGHGGEDSGSEAYDLKEKDLTLGIAGKIVSPSDNSVGVFFTRTDDSTVSSKDRQEYAKKLDFDLLVTIHTNADKDTRTTRGVKILYNDDKVRESADELAVRLQRLSDAPEKVVTKEKKIPGFEDIDVPCIFIGTGFITNRSEAQLVGGEEYEEKAAKAIEEIF